VVVLVTGNGTGNATQAQATRMARARAAVLCPRPTCVRSFKDQGGWRRDGVA
jgi:ribosomal protein S9